jgi:tetratricopeptide (TPR) repeat protein
MKMKQRSVPAALFLLSWMILTPVLLQGQDSGPAAATTLREASRQYQNRQYETAARIYDSLIRQGYQDASLYYDAGNAFYKAGHLGEGIYYFEKARELDPNNSFIGSNLQLARQHTADHVEALPVLFFVRWEQRLVNFLSPNAWVICSIIFFWLLVAGVGLRLMVSKGSGLSSFVCLLLVCGFIGSMACAIFRYRRIVHPGYAIIMSTEIPVRNAPDLGSPDAFDIHEGLRVQVLDTAGNWEKIRMADGRTGWVPGSDLRKL